MDRLDAAQIRLPGVEVRVLARCDSTNTVLFQEKTLRSPVVLAAEEQTAGRGRRGRRWHGTAGRDISFSLPRRVARPPRELAALSLLAGGAAAQALRAPRAGQAAPQWPNELRPGGAKA